MVGKEYGKIIRVYRGKGKLKLTNGDEFTCQVTIQQVDTGGVFIICRFTSAVAQAVSAIQFIRDSSPQEAGYAYGKTKDGLRFKSRGKLFTAKLELFSSKSSVVTLIAQEVDLWLENGGHAERYKFSVVNFEFAGNHPAKRIVQSAAGRIELFYRNLELKIPWGIAIVDPVPDYADVVRRIKAQKGISVTCEISVQESSVLEFPDVIGKIDELCRLLSLARGTKINWINAETYTDDGDICQIILKNSVTWPFSSSPLIDPRNPEDTPTFIEKVYPTYIALCDTYNLSIAIEQYLDAKRETVYLETRGLAAVTLLDSLQQLHASRYGVKKIIKDFRGQKEKEFRKCLRGLLVSMFPGIQSDNLEEMIEKTPELNRKSFSNMLMRLINDLGLKIPRAELTVVKRTRNELVHNMRFKSTDPKEKRREYFRVINIIEQILLKLLTYDGYYIHMNLLTLSFERKKLD